MNEQIESYNFFSSFFFNLTDRSFVEKVLSYDFGDDEVAGVALIKEYVRRAKLRDIEEVRTEIAVDRTYLLHGVTPEGGPRPPYESLYVGDAQEIAALSINRFYRQNGFKVQEGVGQPPDYIGIELAFMELLLKEGEATFETQKDFFNKHLSKWGTLYADEMIKFARTDFWRGIGHLLKCFLEEEAEVYS